MAFIYLFLAGSLFRQEEGVGRELIPRFPAPALLLGDVPHV